MYILLTNQHKLVIEWMMQFFQYAFHLDMEN